MEMDLKCGFGKMDITPPVGIDLAGYGKKPGPSEGILDPLYSKAVVFNYGDTTVAISANDLLCMPSFITEKVRSLIEARIHIPGEHILLSATHNHFGPLLEHMTMIEEETVDKDWIEGVLIKKIADTICLAYDNMQSAMIGVGSSEVAGLAYNRRGKRKDGRVETVYDLAEDRGHSVSYFESKDAATPLNELEFGPADPDFLVLSAYSADNNLIGSLLNFSCHAICNRDLAYKKFSADFPGCLTDEIEKSKGGICLFTAAPSADVNPVKRDSKYMSSVLSKETLKLLNMTKPTKYKNIQVKRKEVELPLRKLPSIEEARQEFEKQNRLNSDKRHMARRYLYYAERYKGCTHIEAEVQIIGLEDVLFIGLPGEITVEIGLSLKDKIKSKIGLRNVFIISLANNYTGEVITDRAYQEGGDEPKTTRLGPGSEEVIIETVMELLK